MKLTWEDIRKIVVISEDVFEEGNNLTEKEYYEEVLRRFNETPLIPMSKRRKEHRCKKLFEKLNP